MDEADSAVVAGTSTGRRLGTLDPPDRATAAEAGSRVAEWATAGWDEAATAVDHPRAAPVALLAVLECLRKARSDRSETDLVRTVRDLGLEDLVWEGQGWADPVWAAAGDTRTRSGCGTELLCCVSPSVVVLPAGVAKCTLTMRSA